MYGHNYLADGGLALDDPFEDEEDQIDLDAPGPDEDEVELGAAGPMAVMPPPAMSYMQEDIEPPPVEAPPPTKNYPVFRSPQGIAADQPRILSVPQPPTPKPRIIAGTDASPMVAPDIIDADIPGHASLPTAPHRIVGKDTTYEGALKTLAQESADRPVMTAPKWYQKLGAAALGAASGYSNAAGRARPINISDATENILHPGYKTKLEEWQSRVVPAQQQADILGQQVKAERESNLAQSQERLRAAQALQAMQHGAYWQSRSEQERNQWKIDPKTGNLYNTIDGRVVNKAPTAKDRYETAIALGATKDEAKQYALAGKITTTAPHAPAITAAALAMRANGAITGNPQIDAMDPKAALKAIDDAKDRDPMADLYRQTMLDQKKQADLDAIGNWKADRERQIIHDRNQALKADAYGNLPSEDAIQRINDAARVQLQQVQDQFAGKARARGLNPDDYDVSIEGVGPGKAGSITYKRRNTLVPTVTPAPQHAPTPAVDPQVKAYADAYFRGDVAAAQAAIKQQRGQ